MAEISVNGETRRVDVEGDTPLLWVLRDSLGLTGTKYGCGIAQCGACTVLVDGEAVRSCQLPLDGLAGRRVTTIEAIEADPVGARLVAAWVALDVPQCGYCQSGQLMAATALLKATPRPEEADIAAAMTNLCRCGTYNMIAAGIRQAADAA
jgi:isoquinoline 1-oxidoreductase alpha subunit